MLIAELGLCELGSDDVLESFVLFADEMVDGHFDVLECDVRSAARPHALTLHLLRRHTLSTLNQQQADASHTLPARSNGHREEVCEYAVGDPCIGAQYREREPSDE